MSTAVEPDQLHIGLIKDLLHTALRQVESLDVRKVFEHEIVCGAAGVGLYKNCIFLYDETFYLKDI